LIPVCPILLNENRVGEEEAIVNMEYNYADGASYDFDRKYVRIGNQWRQNPRIRCPISRQNDNEPSGRGFLDCLCRQMTRLR